MSTGRKRVNDMQKNSEYYELLAGALISNADGICDAIDRYIAKADDDLEQTLSDEGYAEAEETVTAMNSMEEEIADILQAQTDELVVTLEASEGAAWDEVQQNVTDMIDNDDIEEQIAEVSANMLHEEVPHLASVYIQESDGELAVGTLRQRTLSWISSWSQQLGNLMKISTHQQITNLIQNAIESGSDIASLTRTITDGGWRSEYYQAKRVAVTEVLRAHSVAREEAIQQSPSIDRKEWKHTGAHKNKPRPNHVDMDGQIVPKNQPFVLRGRDGTTYYPMYPRDPILPASESVNCHCIHRGVAADDALGMSLEERRHLQQKYIDEDNDAWKKELDVQNKAKSGITPYSALENFNEKTREKQTKYLGKSKMALYDAGLIDSDEMLKKVKKSTLQELREDGIFTVSSPAVKHSTVGEFSNLSNPKKPAGGRNGGNMKGGGHSQANLDELTNRGIPYNIETTYDNGVRIGGVANHTVPEKRLGNSGQSWFPEDWDFDKIAAAGTYTANRPAITEELYDDQNNLIGYRKFQKYDGVTVGIFEDAEHNIDTVFPDAEQREVGD